MTALNLRDLECLSDLLDLSIKSPVLVEDGDKPKDLTPATFTAPKIKKTSRGDYHIIL
jgi:hypothetical protein